LLISAKSVTLFRLGAVFQNNRKRNCSKKGDMNSNYSNVSRCSFFRIAIFSLCAALGCRWNFTATAQTNFQRLVNFYDGIQGTNTVSYPRGELIEGSDGYLYGVIEGSTVSVGNGISQRRGAVYRLAKDGSQFTVLQGFFGGQGDYPISGLLEASDGNLYGVTKCFAYWDDTDGVVYSLGKDGSDFRMLYRLETNSIGAGAFPNGPLVEGDDGALYGTTRSGFIFKINKDGNGYQHVHAVGGMISGLLMGSDRRLYGCDGGLFAMNQDGSGFTYLYSSLATNPLNVTSRPFEASDGLLYGTSYGGGTSNAGTIFSIQKNGGGFQVLHNFLGDGPAGDAAAPIGGVVEGNDGALYGTANYGGASHVGIIYKINKDGSSFQILRNLSGADGGYPDGALLLGSDGALYGSSGADFFETSVWSDYPEFFGQTLFKLFSTAPVITFSGIQAGTNGVTLNLVGGASGQNLNIQATTDPTTTNGWQVIGSATAAVDGTIQFTDTNAPNFSARFYRGAAQ
jgi:uncharacterized repeat protein (TIGR03803 family)